MTAARVWFEECECGWVGVRHAGHVGALRHKRGLPPWSRDRAWHFRPVWPGHRRVAAGWRDSGRPSVEMAVG